MTRSNRTSWIPEAVLVGLVYGFIGIAFAIPMGSVRVWRLAAWVISVVVFLAHARYEHIARRSNLPSAAVHVAIAAGLGAFCLAVGANVHSLFTSSHQAQRLLLIALVLWPLMTAVPAFVVALGIGGVLSRVTRGAQDR